MTATATIPIETRDSTEACARSAGAEFLRLIPRDFARDHLIISQGRRDGVERLAVAHTTSPAAVFNVSVHLGVDVETSHADGEAIAKAIDEAYGSASPEAASTDPVIAASQPGDVDDLLAAADRDLLSTQGKGPIVKLVDALLFEALSRGASDVHVQPLADRTLVRYRLDGVLHTVREFKNARQFTAAIVSRIKVMGRMDIAERRLPQDGRAAVNIGPPAPGPGPGITTTASREQSESAADNSGGGRAIDLRISTLPTSYGERAVIRLLDNSNHLCDFEKIGMPPEVAERYLERARRANGMILLTGPTGSGKTTTLYSTLRRIGSPTLNIMTIEDPIEYELATVGLAISQAQVNPRKGVTFSTGLRHILRQDPDVVMVGEIRDAETARIAIQSSLTGHLVFSTLHTNDSPSAVTRLIDLGVEPYLVSASLSAVLAQRLVRTLHAPCGGPSGGGCEACFGTGYLGRTGIFELMTIDETIAELISDNAPVSKIREAARTSGGGLRTLAEDGERLVRMGRTSREEVRRVCSGGQGAWG